MQNTLGIRHNYDPEIWGGHGWFFLETIALSYPINPTDEQKYEFATFFDSMKKILPCGKCRKNYMDHIKVYPLTDDVLRNRDNLVDWLLKIHNSARISMGKKSITLEEYIKYYADKYNKTDDTYFYYILLGIGIIILMWIIKIYK